MIIVRNYIKSKGFFVLLILLFSTPAFADLEKGFDAYQKGDYHGGTPFESLRDKLL